jgi:hypothetical protein
MRTYTPCSVPLSSETEGAAGLLAGVDHPAGQASVLVLDPGYRDGVDRDEGQSEADADQQGRASPRTTRAPPCRVLAAVIRSARPSRPAGVISADVKAAPIRR